VTPRVQEQPDTTGRATLLTHGVPMELDEFDASELLVRLDDVRARATEVVDLDVKPGAFLAFFVRGMWTDVVLFDWVRCDEDDTNVLVSVIFEANGPEGNLMELRHTYFARYLFYLNLEAVEQAMHILKARFSLG
jgi:hypothetical protein